MEEDGFILQPEFVHLEDILSGVFCFQEVFL